MFKATSVCPICNKTLQDDSPGLVMLFLCRHVVHASCVRTRDASGSEGEYGGLVRSLEPYLGDGGFASGGKKGIGESVVL
jgi:hypothetical protein